MSDPSISTTQYSQDLEGDPTVWAQKLFVAFLKGTFNFAEGDFHWAPDGSALQIRAGAPVSTFDVSRPMLTVVMGPSQSRPIGIDGMLSTNLSTNQKVRTELHSGTLIVYCVAGASVFASRLAHYVRFWTTEHQRLLESAGGFHRIGREGIGVGTVSEPGQLIAGDVVGAFMVQVNIPYHLQWTWRSNVGRQSPQLRSIAMMMQEQQASQFPYTAPVKLERVELGIFKSPVLVRRITRCGGVVETLQGSELQRVSLLPFPADEE